MSLFVSYSFADKGGSTGFGSCSLGMNEPRGFEDLDRISTAIIANDPKYTAVVVMNWKLFAADPPT